MLQGYKTVFDISPEITSNLAVFPGDVPFSRAVSMDFEKGDHLALSAITTTVHIGAHTDAPNHYHADGESIEARSLHYYLGQSQVVTVSLSRGERIRVKDLSHVNIIAERVLFKTGSFPDPSKWNEDFNALSGEAIEWLHRKKVILVGIDTPSIDLARDKVLESHQAVYANNMAVLEGIVLDQVSDGIYDLIALPLRIKGADASPVRAVLCKK